MKLYTTNFDNKIKADDIAEAVSLYLENAARIHEYEGLEFPEVEEAEYAADEKSARIIWADNDYDVIEIREVAE